MSLTARLTELVAFDTQNPRVTSAPPWRRWPAQLRDLGAAEVEVRGRGRARFRLRSVRDGTAAAAGQCARRYCPRKRRLYQRRRTGWCERAGRLYGLGAADTKGAIAAIMEAIADANARGKPPRGVAVLFSGDEERRGTCIRQFLAEPRLAGGLERAVVCEPTGCAMGWRHRGIGAAEAVVTVRGGPLVAGRYHPQPHRRAGARRRGAGRHGAAPPQPGTGWLPGLVRERGGAGRWGGIQRDSFARNVAHVAAAGAGGRYARPCWGKPRRWRARRWRL